MVAAAAAEPLDRRLGIGIERRGLGGGFVIAWDGTERRNDDHASRITSLEIYSKTHAATLEELKSDLRSVASGVQSISRDMAAAKVGGRVILSVALVAGGVIGWAINLVGRS